MRLELNMRVENEEHFKLQFLRNFFFFKTNICTTNFAISANQQDHFYQMTPIQ